MKGKWGSWFGIDICVFIFKGGGGKVCCPIVKMSTFDWLLTPVLYSQPVASSMRG